MSKLVIPKDGPRVKPLPRNAVGPYVLSEYDKSINTWGIPNNLIKTMSCLPQLGLTEVDYANSFIFDEGKYEQWPDPADPTKKVMFPMAGFTDRATKELVINLVSLLNRSRYSITHHSVIGFGTLSAFYGPEKAEKMLLHLVDAEGNSDYKHRNDIYNHYQLAALKLAETLCKDAHDVTDEEFNEFRELCRVQAVEQIRESSVLSSDPATKSDEYVTAYVDGMLVEMTWCILHFAGLLNKWFTVMKMLDESDEEKDGIDFVSAYNKNVPEDIRIRNNALLGESGWGN